MRAPVRSQNGDALSNLDQFVLSGVAVRRIAPRGNIGQAHAKVSQPEGFTKLAFHAARHAGGQQTQRIVHCLGVTRRRERRNRRYQFL